jgi:hypothetical protein
MIIKISIGMRIFFLLFFLLLFPLAFIAQEDYNIKPPHDYAVKPAKTAIFLELAGNAGLYSINVDRIYFYHPNLKISGRVGLAVNMNSIYYEPIIVLENNFIFLKNPHHLELGLGGTLQRRFNEKPNQPDIYNWENILFSVWRFGYRYQKQDDGLFFRAAVTPIIMSNDALGFHPNYFQFWFGISIGMSF